MDNSLIKNYTSGPVARQLLTFAWPLMVSNLLQAAYNLVDMIVVGRMVGTVGLSAVSVGADIQHLYTLAVMGLGNAGQVLLSQYVGVNDRRGVSRIVGTMVVTIFGMGFVISIAGVGLTDWWMKILNVQSEAVDSCRVYTLCCTYGLVLNYGYSLLSSILRGLGDSRHPMMIIVFSSVLNIVLDILFVGVGMGVFGAALATVVSQGISFFFALAYLVRKRGNLGFSVAISDLKPQKKSLSLLIKLGIPMMIQGAAISISGLYVSSCINTYGVTATAVTGVGNKLSLIVNVVTLALNHASGVIIGQNFAAHKFNRVHQTVIAALAINLVFAGILSVGVGIWPAQIFSLFDEDSEVLAMSYSYSIMAILNFLSAAVRSPSSGLCNGMGFPVMNFIIGVVDGFVARIGLSFVLGKVFGYGLRGFWLGSALAGFASFVIMCPYFLNGRWKKKAPPIYGE